MLSLTRQLTLPSVPSSTAEAVHFVEAIAEALHFPEATIDRLLLVTGEAVANAIEHGNSDDPERLVQLEWTSEGAGGWLAVEDEGSGYDAERFEHARLPDNPMQSGGRGLYIIRLLTDGIAVEEGRLRLRFIPRPDEQTGAGHPDG